MQGLLDQLAPHPAVVMTPWFESVAYNAPFRFMIDDLESIPETVFTFPTAVLADAENYSVHAQAGG